MVEDRITVRLGGRLIRQLDDIASGNGRSRSELVREAVQRWLAQVTHEESFTDRARRLGIIGVAKDLPPDLSANPEYMEGFGRGK